MQTDTSPARIRLDKWLWAARFFKTRTLAQAACEGGKVHLDGRRAKPAAAVRIGAWLELRQGLDLREVEILALSEQRGPASVAQTLYRESEESLARRAAAAEQRRLLGPVTGGKPDKQQRRALSKLRGG